MISKELRARIRRLYYAEHWKIGTIATELDLHHDTVERAIGHHRFASGARRVAPSKLDPYKTFIDQTLQDHPRLRATRLLEMLKARGYDGSVAVVRRYVRRSRPRPTEAYLRLSTLPGEQGQVDWGHFGKIRVGAAVRALSCFVMVLSWSRAMFARFFFDQSLESFLRGHVLAFSAFGGTPRQLLYDNLKTAVLERVGQHIRFHPQLLELAGHYHFAPKACAPYRGNEKGRVERAISYLRHSFFAARRYDSLDDLNAQLERWIQTVAHQRRRPGDTKRRSVIQALTEERPLLLPLAAHPFETDQVRPVRSGKTPYVRFDLNDYSIPADYCGRQLTLVASETAVRIVDEQGRLLATHTRSYDKGRVIEDRAHLDALAADKRAARAQRGRHRLLSACPASEPFVEALAKRGTPMSPQTTALLSLLDRYGALALDAALAEALQREAISASSVAHILDQRHRACGAPPALPVVLADEKRVEGMDVPTHDLTTYDQLAVESDSETDDDPSTDDPR